MSHARQFFGPFTALLFLLLNVFGPIPKAANGQGGCVSCTPSQPVPPERWDDLEPRAIVGDTTRYLFNYEPRCVEPFWHDVDVENGLMFTVTGSSFQIFGVNIDANDPPGLSDYCKPTLAPWRKSDTDFYAIAVDAPPGVNSSVAIGLQGGMGMVIMDTSNPSAPSVIYQHEGDCSGCLSLVDVHATTIGGIHYAIGVDQSFNLWAYNMTAAQQLTSPCLDTGNTCPGVFLGRPEADGSQLKSVRKIDGFGRFIVLRGLSETEVWDFQGFPGSDPVKVGAIGPRPFDVAMWKQSGTKYIAAAYGQEVKVFSIPCAGNGTCTPVLEKTLSTPGGILSSGLPGVSDTLDLSRSDGKPYLYVGSVVVTGSGPQHEYLFDLSDLTAPDDLTPMVHPDGYWGWYYEDNPTGFNNVAGLAGKMYGGRFYRAAYSILDVHELVRDRPPTTSFSWQPSGVVHGGETINLSDTSTGSPTGWSWVFDWDGSPPQPSDYDSTLQYPSWQLPDQGPYPRDYSVWLEACNVNGCNQTSRVVTVEDPTAPTIKITSFRALLFCVSGLCEANPGQSIEFSYVVEGEPEFYDYDWNGDGIFEDSNHVTPVASHSYVLQGTFRPKMRVRQLGFEDTFHHLNQLIVLAPLAGDDFESGGLANWS